MDQEFATRWFDRGARFLFVFIIWIVFFFIAREFARESHHVRSEEFRNTWLWPVMGKMYSRVSYGSDKIDYYRDVDGSPVFLVNPYLNELKPPEGAESLAFASLSLCWKMGGLWAGTQTYYSYRISEWFDPSLQQEEIKKIHEGFMSRFNELAIREEYFLSDELMQGSSDGENLAFDGDFYEWSTYGQLKHEIRFVGYVANIFVLFFLSICLWLTKLTLRKHARPGYCLCWVSHQSPHP